MTENESINELQANTDLPFGFTVSDEVSEMAIQALEEIQQYRAIGTVEQLKTMFGGYWKLKDLCEEYEKYGLPEDYWKLNEMCKEYSAIGTIDELKALKEKSVAKKPVNKHKRFDVMGFCPSCQMDVYYPSQTNYCSHCGQKLDWQ